MELLSMMLHTMDMIRTTLFTTTRILTIATTMDIGTTDMMVMLITTLHTDSSTGTDLLRTWPTTSSATATIHMMPITTSKLLMDSGITTLTLST